MNDEHDEYILYVASFNHQAKTSRIEHVWLCYMYIYVKLQYYSVF